MKLLDAIYDEMKLPGSSFVKRLFIENPILALRDYDSIGDKPEADNDNEGITVFNAIQRSALFLHDEGDSLSLLVSDTLKAASRTDDYFGDLRHTKIGLLYSLFENDVAVADNLDNSSLKLEELSDESLNTAYSQAVAIINQSTSVGPSSSKVSAILMLLYVPLCIPPPFLVRTKTGIQFLTSSLSLSSLSLSLSLSSSGFQRSHINCYNKIDPKRTKASTSAIRRGGSPYSIRR